MLITQVFLVLVEVFLKLSTESSMSSIGFRRCTKIALIAIGTASKAQSASNRKINGGANPSLLGGRLNLLHRVWTLERERDRGRRLLCSNKKICDYDWHTSVEAFLVLFNSKFIISWHLRAIDWKWLSQTVAIVDFSNYFTIT